MMGFRKADKTIIICSHSMYLVNELCSRAIWLKNGRVQRNDNAPSVVSAYLAYLEGDGEGAGCTGAHRPSGADSPMPDILIENVRLLNENKEPVGDIHQFQAVIVQVKTKRNGPPIRGHLAVGFGFTDGAQVFETTTKMSGMDPILFSGEQTVELIIPSIPILGGNYVVRARVGDEYALRTIHQMSLDPFVIQSEHPEIGMVWIPHSWKIPEKDVTGL